MAVCSTCTAILAGGFPMILQRQTSRARTSWFADYVDLVVMRDVLDIARIRQREALPRLLRQFAAQTGQLLNITKAGQAVGLNGLRLLRDRLGDRFTGGFVLNLGELAYRKESKIAVMPLSALWSLPGRCRLTERPPLTSTRCTGNPSRLRLVTLGYG